MSRPLLLDLFCGAGGAAMGYHRAGFEVVGVDIRKQPHYPFRFIQGDALNPPVDLSAFDAIHASPPCQKFTPLKAMWNSREYPDLIEPTRSLCQLSGLPFVIENVPQAPLRATLMLCGTMFGLGSGNRQLRRHRLFEVSFPVGLLPGCNHCGPSVVGVYGHSGGNSSRDGTPRSTVRERREAMGIEWMTNAELSEAIPPAYTEFIGLQLIRALGAMAGQGRLEL
jgi:DNA (cytosine-5)-methyltransferase 1